MGGFGIGSLLTGVLGLFSPMAATLSSQQALHQSSEVAAEQTKLSAQLMTKTIPMVGKALNEATIATALGQAKGSKQIASANLLAFEQSVAQKFSQIAGQSA